MEYLESLINQGFRGFSFAHREG